MEWLRLVGSLKSWGSFAEYSLFSRVCFNINTQGIRHTCVKCVSCAQMCVVLLCALDIREPYKPDDYIYIHIESLLDDEIIGLFCKRAL